MRREQDEPLKGFKQQHSLFLQSKTLEEAKTLINYVTMNSRFILTKEEPEALHFSFMVKKNTDINTNVTEQYPFFHVIMRITQGKDGTKIDMLSKKMKSTSWNGILFLNGFTIHLIIGTLCGVLFYWFWTIDWSRLINLLVFLVALMILTLGYWKLTEPFRYWLFGLKIPMMDIAREITTRSKTFD